MSCVNCIFCFLPYKRKKHCKSKHFEQCKSDHFNCPIFLILTGQRSRKVPGKVYPARFKVVKCIKYSTHISSGIQVSTPTCFNYLIQRPTRHISSLDTHTCVLGYYASPTDINKKISGRFCNSKCYNSYLYKNKK